MVTRYSESGFRQQCNHWGTGTGDQDLPRIWTDSHMVFTARRNARIASAVLATAIPPVCLSHAVLCQNDGA